MKCSECEKVMHPADRRTWCEHANAEYEKAWEKWEAELGELIESARRSQMLTAEDYNIRINCIAD